MSELLSPKNIGIAGVAVLILGLMGWRLASYYQWFGIGAPKPSTDPAVIDPTSTLLPEEKKQLEKIQEQERIEEAKPNRPPPSGS